MVAVVTWFAGCGRLVERGQQPRSRVVCQTNTSLDAVVLLSLNASVFSDKLVYWRTAMSRIAHANVETISTTDHDPRSMYLRTEGLGPGDPDEESNLERRCDDATLLVVKASA